MAICRISRCGFLCSLGMFLDLLEKETQRFIYIYTFMTLPNESFRVIFVDFAN